MHTKLVDQSARTNADYQRWYPTVRPPLKAHDPWPITHPPRTGQVGERVLDDHARRVDLMRMEVGPDGEPLPLSGLEDEDDMAEAIAEYHAERDREYRSVKPIADHKPLRSCNQINQILIRNIKIIIYRFLI